MLYCGRKKKYQEQHRRCTHTFIEQINKKSEDCLKYQIDSAKKYFKKQGQSDSKPSKKVAAKEGGGGGG